MKYYVEVEEKWINKYVVDAKNEEEAKKLVVQGSLGRNYHPANGTKKALPIRFVDFVDITKVWEK